jgi:hypothetical protein
MYEGNQGDSSQIAAPSGRHEGIKPFVWPGFGDGLGNSLLLGISPSKAH